MNLPYDTNASNAIAVQHLIQLPTLSLKPEVTFYVQFFNYLLHQTEITHSLAPIYQCIFSVSSLPCPWLAFPPLSIILSTCSSHSLPHTLIQGGSFRDWSEKPSSLYKSSWLLIPSVCCSELSGKKPGVFWLFAQLPVEQNLGPCLGTTSAQIVHITYQSLGQGMNRLILNLRLPRITAFCNSVLKFLKMQSFSGWQRVKAFCLSTRELPRCPHKPGQNLIGPFTASLCQVLLLHTY